MAPQEVPVHSGKGRAPVTEARVRRAGLPSAVSAEGGAPHGEEPRRRPRGAPRTRPTPPRRAAGSHPCPAPVHELRDSALFSDGLNPRPTLGVSLHEGGEGCSRGRGPPVSTPGLRPSCRHLERHGPATGGLPTQPPQAPRPSPSLRRPAAGADSGAEAAVSRPLNWSATL